MRDFTHSSNTALTPIGLINNKNKQNDTIHRASCASPQSNISHTGTMVFFSQDETVFASFSGLSHILNIPTGTVVGAALKLVANRSFDNRHLSLVAFMPYGCDRAGFSALVVELNKTRYRVDAGKVAEIMRVLGA